MLTGTLQTMGPSSGKLEFKHITEAGKEEIAYITGRKDGAIKSLITPWNKFNQASMNGIEWGSITTIAGMSGTGKTAILNELETGLFEKNPDQEFAVLSFNFEMQARRLVGRKISKHLSKTVKEIYSADIYQPKGNITQMEVQLAEKYVETVLSQYNIYYVDGQGSVLEIENTIRHFFENILSEGQGLVVTIDHSILVRGKTDTDNQLKILYDLGRTINDLKKEFKVSFIILSQLNRDIERVERKNNSALHYPQKSDVFGADALYQYSDVFMITHNPYALGIPQYGPEGWETKGYLYWHFIKTRDDQPFIAQMINALHHNKILE